jgi:hypothetical protein
MSVTLNELRGMLKINKHCLDDELEVQAHVQFEISEAVAITNMEQTEAKNYLEKYDAELLLDIRKENSKRTAAEVQAEIDTDGEHLKFLRTYNQSHHEYELWFGMHEAWKQRGFALKSLADLSMSNYFAVDTAYEKNRGRVAESRQPRNTINRHRRT